jgi:DNA-binding response OmpR family regulator
VWQALIRAQTDVVVLDASVTSVELNPWLLISELSWLDRPLLIALIDANCSRDHLRALQSGVCYCLTMPIAPRELASLLTVVGREGHKTPKVGSKVPEYADLAVQIDLANREIRRKGKTFRITGRERSLLQLLIAKAGKVISSDELCRATWGRGSLPAMRLRIRTYILQLRRKIEHDYRHPRYLISRHGVGYAFMPQMTG